ncbi:helix-turn-helix transcriptional regulator [Paenibacillus hexagrammi]|uniref:AraC family transcriptional regulator n=1 Tax=Paenibacillus hexagrammi TaxID=2908839 RepID=A0ABY3SFB3_9BACL|nr:AraC family transcriptional regulator [Paenibacillus sp. YPD9-1]UJF31929.1 AraC family transcriptional regulator [Paenibacillus sp. YPD9-1]
MTILQFTAPPLPYYISTGFSMAQIGRKHPERYQIGEFDLLVVNKGCLYVGEEDKHYEVSEGHALVLRPDLHHYPTEGNRTETGTFWLHFQTQGSWRAIEQRDLHTSYSDPEERTQESNNFRGQAFTIQIPQFTKLLQPAKVYESLQQLQALEKDSHQNWVRWKQQTILQEILGQLSASLESQVVKPSAAVADQAASYLRLHYRDSVTAQELGEAINFHPVYIARCMQKEFGCSPMDYLLRYRVERAKLLLLQTDLPVAYIAEEVGFNHAAYFTSCFSKYEGITPRTYRQQFAKK